MSETTKQPSPFVTYLIDKLARNPRAMRELKRADEYHPDRDLRAIRYVAAWVPRKASAWQRKVPYVVAMLFANHPHDQPGQTLPLAYRSLGSEPHYQHRFQAMLNSPTNVVVSYLLVMLRELDSKPLDWDDLYRTLWAWEHPDRYAQQRWARAYNAYVPPGEKACL